MSNILPNLLNPAQIVIERIDTSKTKYDPLRKTPINHVATKTSFTIQGQVVWAVSTANQTPDYTQAGEVPRELGYIMMRTRDLNSLGQTIQKDDRIVSIGGIAQSLYIERLQYGSHYNGIFQLVKVFYTDRRGESFDNQS